MDIDRPKEPGHYAEREFDCARALQTAFDQAVSESGQPFLDVDRIAAALMDRAAEAGWTRADINAAIDRLASNRQSADKDIRRIEPAK